MLNNYSSLFGYILQYALGGDKYVKSVDSQMRLYIWYSGVLVLFLKECLDFGGIN